MRNSKDGFCRICSHPVDLLSAVLIEENVKIFNVSHNINILLMFNSINLFKMIFMYKYCHINYKKEYQAK